MAESTLSLGIDEFEIEVGRYLGLGATVANWTTEETARVDRHIQAGVRRVYYPPPIKEGDIGHEWSFLKRRASGLGAAGSTNITTGVASYVLPDDYGGGLTGFQSIASSNLRDIRIIDLDELNGLNASNNRSDVPEYAAIFPTSTGVVTTGQRWSLIVYPTPNATYEVRYKYDALTDKLVTSTNPFPLGGGRLSELYKSAILAEAEYAEIDTRGPKHSEFMAQLANAVAYDNQLIEKNEKRSIFPDNADLESEGSASFPYLLREVGAYLGYGRSDEAWDTTELGEVTPLSSAVY